VGFIVAEALGWDILREKKKIPTFVKREVVLKTGCGHNDSHPEQTHNGLPERDGVAKGIRQEKEGEEHLIS
jgi:hypothetical protein